MDISDLLNPPTEPLGKTVVRLVTSHYSTKKGIVIKKELLHLRRLSKGGWIEEDIQNVGVDLFFKSLTNLNECKDGVYEIEAVNISKDWETGYVDNYDYALKPLKIP